MRDYRRMYPKEGSAQEMLWGRSWTKLLAVLLAFCPQAPTKPKPVVVSGTLIEKRVLPDGHRTVAVRDKEGHRFDCQLESVDPKFATYRQGARLVLVGTKTQGSLKDATLLTACWVVSLKPR